MFAHVLWCLPNLEEEEVCDLDPRGVLKAKV